MDNLKIGNYIQNLRKAQKLTQKELADKLNISFQAVSKWETGESLPDTGILLDLCEILNTSVDKLLNGGAIVARDRRMMRVANVVEGFEHLEAVGKCFGENCTFYTGMIEGINTKMNIDILEYLRDPNTRRFMYVEVIIQWILDGKTVDLDEVEDLFHDQRMVDMVKRYLDKTDGTEQQ
ncbi:MAG: helix-turn-helix transcriptional regulator [Clostridia bacterium]|jgi:transcriptional regulator with XRE-family HTH domain|nr:helix-turn-helix transcriptional regulator [Clostridia bacterium]